jgi:subtilase family serine protease
MRRDHLKALAVAIVVVAGMTVPAATAAAANSRNPIAGSKPSWARPDTKVGARAAAAQLQFRVYLHGRDEAGAAATAADVSNPSSPNFRHWLSSEESLARFGPTLATVSAVEQWLTGGGFNVDDVAANRLYVEATGSVAQVQQAFAVQLGTYRVKGQDLRAPDRDLSVPADVAGLIDTVVGIDQSQMLFVPSVVPPGQDGASGSAAAQAVPNTALAGPGTVPPPAGFRNAPPCSQFWAQKLDKTDPPYGGGFPSPLPYAPCGYVPDQLRSVYGMDQALDQGIQGQGVTVAVIDAFASPNLFADAQQYAALNDPAHPLRPSQFDELLFKTKAKLEAPNRCDAAGWYGEQTLDVEAVHAMAPKANILYVGGSDCLDVSLDKALNTVVAHHLAQIVTNSYGDQGEDISGAVVHAFQTIAINAVLDGIGVYFSSGDSGDEVANLGAPSPDFSASSPWVTAVGGTSVGIGARGQRVLETGWETGKSTLTNGAWVPPAPGAFLYGSGGGTSRLFAEPWYQQGVVPNSLARRNQQPDHKGRVVPDIAADGDPNTGMLIGLTQTFPDGTYYSQYRIGGTSLSSPLLAGIMALADSATGYAHGFINPSLYQRLAGGRALTDVRHVTAAVVRVDYVNGIDATSGTRTSVRSFDLAGLAIKTTPGYDTVTGLGTPNGLAFLLLV